MLIFQLLSFLLHWNSSRKNSYPLFKLLDWTQNSFFIQYVIICPVIVLLYILLLTLSQM